MLYFLSKTLRQGNSRAIYGSWFLWRYDIANIYRSRKGKYIRCISSTKGYPFFLHQEGKRLPSIANDKKPCSVHVSNQVQGKFKFMLSQKILFSFVQNRERLEPLLGYQCYRVLLKCPLTSCAAFNKFYQTGNQGNSLKAKKN